jgi:maleylpyruvate isomerase
MIDVLAQRAAIDAATEQLMVGLAGLDDALAAAPSRLPGWNRAMLITHLARNADGIRGMIAGAAEGHVAAMYPAGPAGREADIAAGRQRRAAALLDDLRHAATRLREWCGFLDQAQWQLPGLAPSGEVPLWCMLVARWREVEVHHLDLDLGYDPSDWPEDFVVSELDAAAADMPRRLPTGVSLRLVATDGLGSWDGQGAGETNSDFTVAAPGYALLAWLLERGSLPEGQVLPPIGPWA